MVTIPLVAKDFALVAAHRPQDSASNSFILQEGYSEPGCPTLLALFAKGWDG